MYKKASLFILSLLICTACVDAFADVPIAKQAEIKNYSKLMTNADVVHLDGAVTVDRTAGYQVKWNSATLTAVAGEKNIYIQKRLVGGINKSESKKHIVALIPLRELQETKNPATQIGLVTANGKPAPCLLFPPGNSFNTAIKIAKKAFDDNQLFTTQLDPRVPLLFIDAGIVQPNAAVRIEYEVKLAREIRIN
jgi:hypothetical protein